MGKNDKNKSLEENLESTQDENLNTNSENGIPGLLVDSGDKIEPVVGEHVFVESESVTNEILDNADENISSKDDLPEQPALIEEKSDDLLEQSSLIEEKTLVTELLSLSDAIELSKTYSYKEVIDALLIDGEPDIKVFAAELKEIITAYDFKTEFNSNIGNRKLNSLLQRVLIIEDGSVFKFKFDMVNKLFKDNEYFQPSTLLNCTGWTKSEKELANFAQIITIIEDLAEVSTRNENKKRIGNLSNLLIEEKALENIKKYYKL